jgi:DNA-binding MarR family transcriptional regulator
MTEASAGDEPQLIDALVESAFATVAVLNRLSAEYDLSLTQLRVLAILRDRRLRMTVLANFLGLEKSTMSGLVDRAENRGLLRRESSDADGRAVDVSLSAAGHKLGKRIYRDVAAALAPMTGALNSAEQRRLAALLVRTTRGRQS